MENSFIIFIVILLVVGSFVLRILFPFLIVAAAFYQYRKFKAAIAQQSQVLNQPLHDFLAQPEMQDRFTQAARAAGDATSVLEGRRAAVARQALLEALTRAAQTLPQGR